MSVVIVRQYVESFPSSSIPNSMIHFQRGVNERAFLDTDDDTKSQEGSLDFWQLSPQTSTANVKEFLSKLS